MSKGWKRTLTALLCLVMLLALAPNSTNAIGSYGINFDLAAYTTSNPFYQNGLRGQCTWYAWGRTYEKYGINLPCRGNATTWDETCGRIVGTEPRANSVAVWESSTLGNTYGHVAYVEYVSDTEIRISEANFNNSNINVDYRYSEGVFYRSTGKYVGTYNDNTNYYRKFPDKYIYLPSTLDINGYLDGQSVATIDNYGTFDIYIGGKKVKSGVSEYRNTELTPGVQYTIANVKAASGKAFAGIYAGGDYTGSVSGNTVIALEFRTIKPSTWLKNHAPKKVGKYGGHTYYYFPDKVSWVEAYNYCIKFGGHLVSIGSAGENQFVSNLTEKTTAWIGLTDKAQEGTFKWSNGDAVSYTNWLSGEPNDDKSNMEGSEDYAAIVGADLSSDVGKWNDVYGYAQYGFVCEVDEIVKYTLDVNGWLDGQELDNIQGIGTFDSYIDGKKTENDIYDYYNEILPIGTTYEFNDIKCINGYEYVGVKSGHLSGTMTGHTKVVLEFKRPSTVTTYTVSYDANGGTDAPGQQIKTKGQTLILSGSKPSRSSSNGSYTVTLDPNGGNVDTTSLSATRTTKYTFQNWNTAKNGSGTSYAPGASYTTDASVTLYAQWTSSTTVSSVMLPTPWRYGYNFKGWGTSSTATSGVTGSYRPSRSVTLYALWEKEDLSGWSTTKPDNIYEDQIETATQYRYSDRTAAGGWTLTGSGTIDYVQSWTTGFNTSHSLYAQYNKTPKTPGVSGNKKVEANTVAYGWIYWHWTYVRGWLPNDNYNVFISTDPNEVSANGLPYQYFTAFWSDYDAPAYSGDASIFKYWRDDPNDGSWWWYRIPVYRQTYKEYTGSDSSTTWSDWSVWTMIQYPTGDDRKAETRTVYRYKDSVQPFTVAFDPNGGSCDTASKSVIRGETYGSLPAAKRNGFVFDGWYTAKEGGDLVSAATRVTATGAHTLYARWTNAHTHTAGQPVKENEVAATCVKEGGYDEVTYCTGCGKELSRTHVTVPALGHNPGEPVKENEVTATCTTDGSYDEVVYCIRCKAELSRTHKVEVKHHTPGQPVKENEVPATTETAGGYDEVTYCTRCGAELSRVHKTIDKLPIHVTFKTQPKSVTVKSGSKAKFTVKVKEKHVTYQWYCRAPGAQEWTKIPGANKASYQVEASKANDGWQFRCGVTNETEAFSNPATLTVKIQPPAVKTQPKDLTAKSGKKVKFSVKASGKGLTYTWYSRPNAEAAWTPVAGQTKNSLSIVASKANDGSQYYCHIQNADGEVDSAVVTLTVTPEAPTIKTQPKDAKVKIGAKAKFKVKATGKNVTYQWYYRTSETGEWILLEGQTSANLTVIATEGNIGWQFRCRAWNADGEAYSNPATLRQK